MQQFRIDFKKLRSMIFLQYGIDLDETSLAVLTILRQDVKGQFLTMHKRQDEVAAKIQNSRKALQVDPDHPRWQAFWHGMGQWGLGFCLAVIAVLTVFAIDVNKEREEKNEILQQLIWYKDHYEALQKADNKAADAAIQKKSRQRNK